MYVYFLAIVLLSTSIVHANNACNITNINEFYKNIKSNGPMLSESIKQKEEISSVIDLAKQRPNPELDFEYLNGEQRDIDIKSYTFTAQHIVEFGSKREKRITKAKRFQELKDAEVDLRLFNSNLSATVKYQRIAQLNITIDAVKEVVHTFDKIIRKLSSRKRLNPEEVVSLSTLRLASNDYKNQLNNLENEKIILLGNISFLTNCKRITPKYEELKYKLIKLDSSDSTISGLTQLEDMKVGLALGELDVQKSLGYSNISIGPRIEYQGQGDTKFMTAGVSVSFALPLFQTNDGGKLNALKSVSAQKVSSKNRKEMLNIQRANLVSKIKRSIETLSKMPNLVELEKNHNKVEKLFSRGVVSISMTIESHRQQIDFLKSRFQIENEILSTYGKIISINGNTPAFEKVL
jgi:cobalt-zinc-cadmium efflux system outer membrane protein